MLFCTEITASIECMMVILLVRIWASGAFMHPVCTHVENS